MSAFERPLREIPPKQIATALEIACRNLNRHFRRGLLPDYSFRQVKEELLHVVECSTTWEADSEVSEFIDFYLRAEDTEVLAELEATGEEKALEILTVPEVLALAGEEIAWSVQGILPVGGVGILSGSPGLGKSWLALDLAVEIARGGSWLGQFPCRNDRVLLIDEESAEPLMRLRLGKILAGKGISGDGLNLFFAIGGGFNFSDGEALERFRVAFRRFQPGVVIFDSLIRLHRADENDARQMAAVFGTLKELVRGFNLTVLLIDHHRKPQGFGDSLQQLRGSSEKAAFVDTALTMNRKDKRLVVEHSKSRYAEAVESFIVTITDSAPGQTVVAYGGSAEAAAAEEALASARGFILKALQGGEEVSRQSILEKGKEKGVTKKAIDLALAALEEEGSVVREDRIPEGKTKGRAAFFALQKSLSQSAPYIGGTGKVNERGASGE